MEKDIKNFLEFIKSDKKLSKNTLESYQRDILQYQEYLEEKKIDYKEVNNENVLGYLDYLKGLDKKASTISRHLASIRLFYQYLLKNKIVKEDPTKGIQSPKIEKKAPSILSSQEVSLLLEQPNGEGLKSIRDKAMLEVAYATGMRVTEIISLNVIAPSPLKSAGETPRDACAALSSVSASSALIPLPYTSAPVKIP